MTTDQDDQAVEDAEIAVLMRGLPGVLDREGEPSVLV